jgi:hypothetical protein
VLENLKLLKNKEYELVDWENLFGGDRGYGEGGT